MNVRSIAFAYCPTVLKPLLDRIDESPLGYRLVKGTFWSAAGAFISRGLMFFAAILVARILGTTVYGELGMIRSTLGTLGIFAGFGLSLTASKHIAEFRQSNPERAGRIISLSWLVAAVTGGLMAIGLLIFAPWLAENTLAAPQLSGVLRIGAVILFLNALQGAQTGALSGFEAFKTLAGVNIYVGLISFPVLICGAYFGGLVGAVWALGINLGIFWFLNHLALRKEARRHHVPLSFKHCREELGVLWGFSLPATLSGLLVGPSLWLCNAMLVNQPNGYDQMGLFAAALVFYNLLLLSSRIMTAPLLPVLANVGEAKSSRLEAANILISWAIGLFPAIAMLCFPEVLEFLFGKEFQGYTFRITAAIVLFYTCILTYRSGLMRVLQSQGLLWIGFANNLLWTAVLVPSAYFLVHLGAAGLALSIAIAYIVNSIVFVPVYSKSCKVPMNLVICKESFLIWVILCALVAGVFWEAPIVYRALAMPVCMLLAAWMMQRIWARNSAIPQQA